MPNSYKLPLAFNPEPLKADLNSLGQQEWAGHFNNLYFSGDWSGLALRSIGGDSTRLYPDPHATGVVANTPILAACPNILGVLPQPFDCEIKSARLLRLGPGSSTKEHRDHGSSREAGEIRLHIPLITNERVEFYLDGRLVNMKEGECWYLDFNLPHRVENRGATARVHLVIDCVINDWLDSLLPTEESEHKAEISSRPQLEEFRRHVLNNSELQGRLRTTDDRQSFVRLVIETGRDCGYTV